MYLNRTQDLAIDDLLANGIATQVTAGLSGQFGAFTPADMAVELGFKSFTAWLHLPQPTGSSERSSVDRSYGKC